MEFHKFYFDHLSHRRAINTTIAQPYVRFLGDNVALIAYVRLQQSVTEGVPQTSRFEETRLWQRQGNQWKHIHFHRSDNGNRSAGS
jgi:Calcium/calmodulin dependent protein kinase II association domain